MNSAIAISISAMLGSGIFVLPGLAASLTGPSIWLAYLVAALCVLPAALSKAELATAMPTSGGTYVYVERAFGPLIGTIAGVGLWLSLILKSAFSLVGLSAYLMVLTDVPMRVSALVILVGIICLNIAGVRKVGQTQLVIMSIVFASMLLVVLPGFAMADPAGYWPFFSKGYSGFFTAVAFVFVSYTGVTEISAVAEEVKDPDRALPRAILVSLTVVALLYALVSFVLVGVIPFQDLTKDIRPIYTLALAVGREPLGYLIAVIGVVTLTSMANTGVLASSRFPFAMSRDRLFPTFLSYLHPRFLTPIWCILLTGAVMAVCILCFDIVHIVKLASAFKVLMFILDNACTIVLRETGVQWYTPRYRSAFYPWMQVFGIVSGFGLLAMLGIDGLTAIVMMCGLGSAFFLVYGRHRVNRKSVLRLYGRRALMMLLGGRTLSNKVEDASRHERSTSGAFRIPEGNPFRFENLGKEANVVVPLFGGERSPETLAEIGAALAHGNKVEVVHIKEFPYQTSLDAVLEEDLLMQSLTRRIEAMAEDKVVDVEFDAVVTHDLVSTVHNISDRSHCEWIVMGWHGRERSGLFVRNPIAWLITHLSCNLALFKDAGVRYIRRILVYAKPDDNLELVLATGDHLASIYSAQLTFIRVATADMNEKDRSDRFEFLQQIQERCANPSTVMLIEAEQSVRGVVEASAAFDLLVFGAAHEKHFLDIMFGQGEDCLTEGAPCSVLRLATSMYKKRQQA